MLTDIGINVLQHIDRIHHKYPPIRIDKIYHYAKSYPYDFNESCNGGGTGNPSPTMGAAVGWFKYLTTNAINESTHTAGSRIWQRSYHDHIIRNEQEYQKIWEYIDTNPLKWEEDCFFVK